MNSGSHLIKSKCNCKMKGVRGSSWAPNSSQMTPSIKEGQKLRGDFGETAFGDCEDADWLKGEKAELEKQIYFSNFNAVNRKRISVGKQVIASLGLKKVTSPNIGNLVAFYTIFNFFFSEGDGAHFFLIIATIIIEKQKQSNVLMCLNAGAEIAWLMVIVK